MKRLGDELTVPPTTTPALSAGLGRPGAFCNLDAIISVGYRVKSPEGVRFRQRAARVLREHLTHDYTINRQRFEANAHELEAALALIRVIVEDVKKMPSEHPAQVPCATSGGPMPAGCRWVNVERWWCATIALMLAAAHR